MATTDQVDGRTRLRERRNELEDRVEALTERRRAIAGLIGAAVIAGEDRPELRQERREVDELLEDVHCGIRRLEDELRGYR